MRFLFLLRINSDLYGLDLVFLLVEQGDRICTPLPNPNVITRALLPQWKITTKAQLSDRDPLK
jgi:hypothetical protein